MGLEKAELCRFAGLVEALLQLPHRDVEFFGYVAVVGTVEVLQDVVLLGVETSGEARDVELGAFKLFPDGNSSVLAYVFGDEADDFQ